VFKQKYLVPHPKDQKELLAAKKWIAKKLAEGESWEDLKKSVESYNQKKGSTIHQAKIRNISVPKLKRRNGFMRWVAAVFLEEDLDDLSN
jgi:hypothetical protein